MFVLWYTSWMVAYATTPDGSGALPNKHWVEPEVFDCWSLVLDYRWISI